MKHAPNEAARTPTVSPLATQRALPVVTPGDSEKEFSLLASPGTTTRAGRPPPAGLREGRHQCALVEEAELLQSAQTAVLILPHQVGGDLEPGGEAGDAFTAQVALEHLAAPRWQPGERLLQRKLLLAALEGVLQLPGRRIGREAGGLIELRLPARPAPLSALRLTDFVPRDALDVGREGMPVRRS